VTSTAAPCGALMSKSERDKRPREKTLFYGAGPLVVSFRRKMHIGYFYGDGRESAQTRLAVFRDISFEKGYSAFFRSGDFNVGKNGLVFPYRLTVTLRF